MRLSATRSYQRLPAGATETDRLPGVVRLGIHGDLLCLLLAFASLACFAGCTGHRVDIVYGTDQTEAFVHDELIRRDPWGGYEAPAGGLLARMDDAGALLAFRAGSGFDFYDIIEGRTEQIIFAYESRDRGDLFGEKRYHASNASVIDEGEISSRRRSTLSYPAAEHSGEPLPARDTRKGPPVEYGAMTAVNEDEPSKAPGAVFAYSGDIYGVSAEGRGGDEQVPGRIETGPGGIEQDAARGATFAGMPEGGGVAPSDGPRRFAGVTASRNPVQGGMWSGAGPEIANRTYAFPGARSEPVTAALQPLPVEVAGAQLIERLTSHDEPFLALNESSLAALSEAEVSVFRMPAPVQGVSRESGEPEESLESRESGHAEADEESREANGHDGPFPFPSRASASAALADTGGGGFAHSEERKENVQIAVTGEDGADGFSFLAFFRDLVREENGTYRRIPLPRPGSFSREDRVADTVEKGFYAR